MVTIPTTNSISPEFEANLRKLREQIPCRVDDRRSNLCMLSLMLDFQPVNASLFLIRNEGHDPRALEDVRLKDGTPGRYGLVFLHQVDLSCSGELYLVTQTIVQTPEYTFSNRLVGAQQHL